MKEIISKSALISEKSARGHDGESISGGQASKKNISRKMKVSAHRKSKRRRSAQKHHQEAAGVKMGAVKNHRKRK